MFRIERDVGVIRRYARYLRQEHLRCNDRLWTKQDRVYEVENIRVKVNNPAKSYRREEVPLQLRIEE